MLWLRDDEANPTLAIVTNGFEEMLATVRRSPRRQLNESRAFALVAVQ